MAKWKRAYASPLRVERSGGYVFFSFTAFTFEGELHSGWDVCGYSYEQAKRLFWEQWRDRMPGVYLEFRLPKQFRDEVGM